MCGIFGIVSQQKVNKNDLKQLASHSQQRGKDSSGLVFLENGIKVKKADYDIIKLLNKVHPYNSSFVFGHSRLITNGLEDNQPVVRENVILLHNGIIVNEEEVWHNLQTKRKLKIDSETIIGVTLDFLMSNSNLELLPNEIFKQCKGVISCALVLKDQGKLILLSNNGSLYVGKKENDTYFASEKYPLTLTSCKDIQQIVNQHIIIDLVLVDEKEIEIEEYKSRTENLIPEYIYDKTQASLLQYDKPRLKRCTKCVLPETMPFIRFDEQGVCNYCHNYKLRNVPKPKEELFKLVKPYRKKEGLECIVPFSGGRDSCYGLHLIVDELKLKPVTYTYDWGMVTDLGRRNISRMCAELGVENIIIAADISQKRKNIRMNLEAWLKAPHLGMMAMLTAGDKHFFRYVEEVKKQTGINLNLWGL